MKKFKLLVLSVLTVFALTSCVDDDNDELTGDASTGGLLLLNNPAVGYVVGNNATYTLSADAQQGRIATTSVSIYKSFTSVTDGTTEEILHATIPVSNTTVGETGTISFSVTYEDLIAGLTLNGSSLSPNDGDLNIGDFWQLRYESTLTNGDVFMNSASSKISVGTRFAGKYAVVEHVYYRIGVLRDDVGWPDEMSVESVDAITYRMVEYFGAFDGNEWYFIIDENDYISYPAETPDGDAQTGNGEPFISCQTHPQELTNVPCGSGTNIVVRDDVSGKDTLYMTFGYLTGNTPGNSREFYQVLEKIPE